MTIKASLFKRNRRYNRSVRHHGTIVKSPVNKTYILCAAVFVAGLVAGSVLVASGRESLSKYVEYLVKTQLLLRTESTLYENFISAMIPKLSVLLLCCLFAHCAYGTPALVILGLLNGMSAGMVGGYVYAFSGFRGVLYNVLIRTPSVLLFAVGLLGLMVSGIKTANAIHDMAFKGGCRPIRELSTEVYHALATGAAVSCGSALAESVLFALLGKVLL